MYFKWYFQWLTERKHVFVGSALGHTLHMYDVKNYTSIMPSVGFPSYTVEN